MVLVQNKYKNTLVGVLRTQITFVTHSSPSCYVMPGLHLQRNRRKSAIQKIYDGRGNFNDGCVASGARLLRRLRCSTLTAGPS